MLKYEREVDNRTLRDRIENKHPFRKRLIRKILRKKKVECEHPETCK